MWLRDRRQSRIGVWANGSSSPASRPPRPQHSTSRSNLHAHPAPQFLQLTVYISRASWNMHRPQKGRGGSDKREITVVRHLWICGVLKSIESSSPTHSGPVPRKDRLRPLAHALFSSWEGAGGGYSLVVRGGVCVSAETGTNFWRIGGPFIRKPPLPPPSSSLLTFRPGWDFEGRMSSCIEVTFWAFPSFRLGGGTQKMRGEGAQS